MTGSALKPYSRSRSTARETGASGRTETTRVVMIFRTLRGTLRHLRPVRARPAHDHSGGPGDRPVAEPVGHGQHLTAGDGLPAVRPLQRPVGEHDRDRESLRHRHRVPVGSGDVDAEERVRRLRQATQQPGATRVERDVLRDGRGQRRMAHGGQHDVEAEPEVGLVARGHGDRPLEEDGEVGRLLHLDQEHPRPGRVRLSRGHEHAVARPHADLVEVFQHPVRILGVDLLGEHGRVNVLAEPHPHGRVVAVGRKHMPGLGLAVARVEVPTRERPGGMDVHRQPLARIEQLDEQSDVGGPGGRRSGARPPDRVGRDEIGEERAVGQAAAADLRLVGPMHGGGKPLLGPPRRRQRHPAEGGEPLAAQVEVVDDVGRQHDRAHQASLSPRSPVGGPCAVREGSGFGPARGCGLLAEPVEHPAEIVEQQVGEIVGEAVADDDAQRCDVLPVLRERVRGHEPTLLAQPCRDVEDGEGLLAVDHEREHGQLRAVGEQAERAEVRDLRSQPLRDHPAGDLHAPVAVATEAQEVVVLRDDLAARPGEVERERRHLAAEVVDAEDQIGRQRGPVAPDRPADARVDEPELVPGGVDRGDPGEAEVPRQLGVAEGRDHATGGPVDVHGDVEARALLEVVEGGADVGDGLVAAVERRPEDRDHADGVLVARGGGRSRAEVQPVALHRDEARLDFEVVGELVPADLDVDAHDDVGTVGGLVRHAAGVLPAPLEREPAEHARLAGADGRAADRGGGVRGVPEVGEYVHAPVLQVGRARVLVLVDHVLVERLGHQQPGLRLGPRRDERGQVEPGVAVEHQLVVDDLVGNVGVDLAVGEPEARDVHRLAGEDRVDRHVRAGVRRWVRGGHSGTVGGGPR